MHAPASASCLHVGRPQRNSGVPLSLKRRSLQQTSLPVRKGDIRRVPGGPPDHVARMAFAPSRSTGSGDMDDLCYQRLEAWLRVVDNYREYFTSMAAAELDLATVYARIGDILKVPIREDVLLLPVGGGGIQDITSRLKGLQQLMVENHCAISSAAKRNALEELRDLHVEVLEMRDAYAASMHRLYRELGQCKASITMRTQLLQAAIAAADAASQRDTEVIKDPFIINLEVEALLRKHAEMENRLYAAATAQQERIQNFEPQLVGRLSAAVGRYIDEVNGRHKLLRLAAKRDARAISSVDGADEWRHFHETFADVLASPQGTTGLAKAQDIVYPGMDSEWVKVLRQGVVALKEHGPLFRSTWQSKYGVLTTRGYFHVFRSQGDVVCGAPETSIFLPRARVALGRHGTLQISCGSRFSRCRSLDQRQRRTEPGARARAAKSQGSRRRTLLALSPDRPPMGTPATPTRVGRPFSADASMLAQTPPQLVRIEQCLVPTPTQNLYMLPLASSPAGAPAAKAARPSPAGSASRGSHSFDAYSPSFSETPGDDSTTSDGPLRAETSGDPSSASGPADPASLFEPSLSQDSETAPIGSLPQLSSVRHSSQGFLGRFPAGDRMDAASLGSGGGRWCGSIVDLQRPRQYASSVGGTPAAHGFSQDIWRADLLAVPDPAMRISGGTRTRPRTVICGDSDGGLDPHNPYLGEFLARRQARGSSRASAPAAAAATSWLADF
ncbi:hypothetical protein H4R21_000454 [Coemansia helicoidea]|uniref:Uncharacterized protein n=1 Tax=Coemansia helicoidea TaxID=1286919 RepID=A0ACC1LGB6_9FUNG|nr:hypothetical protein H4R21_000454 [Coemansia helicoidea]